MENTTYIVFMLNTYGVATGNRPYVDAFKIYEDDLHDFKLILTDDVKELEAFEVYSVQSPEWTYFAVGLQSDVNEEVIKEVTNTMLQKWVVVERKSLERKIEYVNGLLFTKPIGSDAIILHY